MIVSHRHRFIFIKTHKTAGTSIEVFLEPQCGPRDIVTPLRPPVTGHTPRNHRGLCNPWRDRVRSPGLVRGLRDALALRRYYNHMPATLVRERVSADAWNGYFKFCVERNPWDKTLSHYHMLRKALGKAHDWSLDDYLDEGLACIDYPLYCDQRGAVIVDRVLQYERLDQDLAEVFRRLGIPCDGGLGIRAKGGYREDRRPYHEVMTREQSQRIARLFACEIDRFQYAF